ncbi:MAG TPA: hypothetical protein PLD82_02120 [Spirochaetota bacterium]|mgnify:CR=1 FL=1|nr:hypothetical protein [Spirochaetota bacterium]HPH02012.1 hypothetical protein [Spirochaetota bacterium]
MRLVGLVLIVALLAGLPLVLSIWKEMTVVPWYLVGVLLFCLGNVVFSYSFREMGASWKLFLKNEKTEPGRHKTLALMHEALSRQALAGGFLVLLAGWIAVFCLAQPPLVQDFGRALSGPFFALILGWGLHRPLANWHRRMAE